MRIERKRSGNIDVLEISGDFDFRCTEWFEREVESLVESSRTRIVVDLSGVRFMDSAALTRLIHMQRRLRALGGEQVIVGPPRSVQTTIRTAGVDRLIRIFPDVDEGRRHFADPGGARSADQRGVPVDEATIGRVEVEFGLMGEEESASTGKVLSTYDDGLLIRYPIDESRARIEPASLAVGRTLWVRFRQPMLEPNRVFETEAKITLAHADPEGEPGASKYRLQFTRIDESDRARMRDLAQAIDAYRRHGRPPEFL